MTDEIQFSNMDSWRGSSGKFGLTFKQIVLMHINRCVQNGSVEFRGGYNKPIQHSNFTSFEYVADTRDVYNNSVRLLRALLLGYYDSKMEKADKDLQKDFDESDKELQEQLKQNQDMRNKVIREWQSYKVDWHIQLFEQLIMLSKRLNFFEEETSEEEM